MDELEVTEIKDNPKRPGGKRALKAFFVVLFLLIALCGIGYYLYNVKPVRDSFTYELGTRISTDLFDYIDGFDRAVLMSELDLSEVKQYPGVYEAKVLHFPFEYTYTVTIVDTIAPRIEGYSDVKAFKVGDTYSIKDVVNKVTDLDPVIDVVFENPSDVKGVELLNGDEAIRFDSSMKVQINVKASDSSGNVSRISFSAVSDDAPVVESYDDYYVAKGTKGSLWHSAYDKADGDVTDSTVVDIDPDYYNVTGTYEVVFRAYDSLGLEGDRYATVHVYEPETIQDMVNTHRIEGLAENVLGVINPYDAGYIIEDNIEKARENLIPSIVRISYETRYVRSFGSGYILKISDTGIILGTNQHVVDDLRTVDVHFFDGTVVKGKVEGRSTSPDIAFVRVNLNDVDEELLRQLKTVHINLEYYQELSSQPFFDIGMYCTDGDGGEWLTHYGTIARKSGWLSEYFENYDYAVTEVSVDLIPGVSGSMIFDSHGNFICMACFYWMNGEIKENYGVSLDSILSFYQTVFGKRLEYN